MQIRRIAVSAAITMFWAVMMVLLVRDHIVTRGGSGDAVEVSPSELTSQWQDYEEWMTLIISGKPQGISYTAIRRSGEPPSYVTLNRIWLDVDVFGRHSFRLETAASLNSTFHLERASANVRLDEAQMDFATLVEGSRLYYRWQYEDRARVGVWRLKKPIALLDAAQPMLFRQLDLKVGSSFRLPVLDSTWSLRQGWAEMRVTALERIAVGRKTTEAYKLAIQLGPFSSTTWVSKKGEVLRRDFPSNISMERADAKAAREQFPGIDAPAEIPKLEPADFRGSEQAGKGPEEEIGPLTLLGELFKSRAQEK
ncbi:hypothetical protein FJY63_09320 [Candidatus Sumerlaeota bacterium]|nr:hypothetical protein [Candidatus Sumerlaeota bacterium]